MEQSYHMTEYTRDILVLDEGCLVCSHIIVGAVTTLPAV